MDNVTVSKRNKFNKVNKENTQPAKGPRPILKRDKVSAVPFHVKSNDKEESGTKNVLLKAREKPTEKQYAPSAAQRRIKTLQRHGKQDASSDAVQQQTHRQAFRRDQAEKTKNITTEASAKAPTALPPTRPAPGMYKGKIVQSKIGSIWKSSTSVDQLDSKTETHRAGTAIKIRSKSVDLPPHKTRTAASTRTAQESNTAVNSRSHAVFYSARPPTRTIQATLTTTGTRSRPLVSSKETGSIKPKPKVAVTDKKVNKPPVTSSLSQYRCNMESVEERRAKLAEWLASKGKTLKRPAMTTAPATHTRVSKPGAQLRPQSSAAQSKPGSEACEPEVPAADKQGSEKEMCDLTEVFISASVELLESSIDEPVDDIVVNLCEALEAMETPSTCNDEVTAVTEEDSGIKAEEGQVNSDVLEEMSESESEPEVKSEDYDKESSDEDDKELESDDDVKTTSKMDASVVKYSVRTTPYLQSVKKTIDGEVSSSRRKSNIKDLKFLTPVRRSTRIQRKSSRLPDMLVDHDTCVSSLAELVTLDDDPNAYIYRKNPALLEDLPDQHRE